MYLRPTRHFITRSPRLSHCRCTASGTDAPAGPGLSDRANLKQLGKVEKLVGYPTPLLSLRHLIGSELSHLSPYFSRLLDSQHPIVRRSRTLLNNPEMVHTQGLVLLLVSKTINIFNRALPDLDQFNILPSQRAIAEIVELIHMAYMMHQEIVDLPSETAGGETDRLKDYAFGNKLVILGGDKLLARASRELALLYNPQIVGYISQAISDLMTGAYLRSVEPLHWPVDDVSSTSPLFQYFHNYSSLLANGCLSCALLAELDDHTQSLVAQFGRSLSIAQLVHTMELGEKLEQACIDSSLLQLVSQEQCNMATTLLSQFPESEARTILDNIIASLCLHR